MYKDHLKSKGYDVGQLNALQKEKLNQILRLESSNRRSMMNELPDEEIAELNGKLIALQQDFESELDKEKIPDPKIKIPLTPAVEEPAEPIEESKSDLGFFAMLGVAALGLLFIASGVLPPKDK